MGESVGAGPRGLTRRRFLQLAGVAGAGLVLPLRLSQSALAQVVATVDPATLTMFRDPLPIPYVVEPD